MQRIHYRANKLSIIRHKVTHLEYPMKIKLVEKPDFGLICLTQLF